MFPRVKRTERIKIRIAFRCDEDGDGGSTKEKLMSEVDMWKHMTKLWKWYD